MAEKITQIKTEWLTMFPSLNRDTYNGAPIKRSAMHMTISGGVATVEHKGKEHEINVGLSGCTIVLSSNGRSCSLNVRRFIDEAVEKGLLNETLDFKTGK